MSSTGSVPASTGAAIIVSHGQPSDPEPAEADLACLRDRVADALPGWRLASATLATSGALDAALAAAGPAPLVYPLFMTEGWFSREKLRARLAATDARLLRPLGVSPDLPALAANLLGEVLAARGWQGARTQLLIAAHGSGRSSGPTRDTDSFARALVRLIPFAGMRLGFIENAPFLAAQAAGLGAKSICLPFFAARRGHVRDDIPQALDAAAFEGIRLDPLGAAPGIPALIARALTEAAQGGA